MRKTDLAYTAGIIDGEGCIGLYAGKKPFRRSGELQVKVSLTNEWLIQWLKFAFGGTVRYEPPRSKVCKPSWRWMICGNKALEFLKLISPYLRLKKPQAEVAIKFQELGFRRSGHVLKDEEWAVTEALRILMHDLNKRGVSNKT